MEKRSQKSRWFSTIVALAAIVGFSATARADRHAAEVDLEPVIEQGQDLLYEGRFDESLRVFEEGIRLADEQANLPRKARFLHFLAGAYMTHRFAEKAGK